jgi:hypothetical protein
VVKYRPRARPFRHNSGLSVFPNATRADLIIFELICAQDCSEPSTRSIDRCRTSTDHEGQRRTARTLNQGSGVTRDPSSACGLATDAFDSSIVSLCCSPFLTTTTSTTFTMNLRLFAFALLSLAVSFVHAFPGQTILGGNSAVSDKWNWELCGKSSSPSLFHSIPLQTENLTPLTKTNYPNPGR